MARPRFEVKRAMHRQSQVQRSQRHGQSAVVSVKAGPVCIHIYLKKNIYIYIFDLYLISVVRLDSTQTARQNGVCLGTFRSYFVEKWYICFWRASQALQHRRSVVMRLLCPASSGVVVWLMQDPAVACSCYLTGC